MYRSLTINIELNALFGQRGSPISAAIIGTSCQAIEVLESSASMCFGEHPKRERDGVLQEFNGGQQLSF